MNEALKKLDQIAQTYETMWGGTLLKRVEIIDKPLKEKFVSQANKLDEAIKSNNDEAITKRSRSLIRGWHLLNSTARKDGDVPEIESCYAFKIKDQKIVFLMPGASIAYVDDNAIMFTLDELQRLISPELIEAKKLFRKSEVIGVSSLPEDDIPF